MPGDVLRVREGDRIPADARLVECSGLIANNAPLTGESRPRGLKAAATDARLNESDNLLFAGCSILRGEGRAVVFATGLRTEFGKIAHLSAAIDRTQSPLERETSRMVRILTIIAVSMGLIFFAYGAASGRSLWVNLVFMMGIIVANVPEGLLPTFTLALAMGSLRMARKNVLVKGLNAVEALGAVHVICTDKTGTLTQNRLRVTTLAAPFGEIDSSTTGTHNHNVLKYSVIASHTEFTTTTQATHAEVFSGDPLDVARRELIDLAKRSDIALAYGNSSTLHRLDDVTRIEVTYSGFGGTAGYRTFAVVTHEAQSIVDPYGGGLYYAVQGTMRVASGTIVNPDITVFPINTAGMPLDRIQDIELLTLRGPATWNYRTTGYEGTFTSYRYVTSYRSPSSVLPATPSDMEHDEQERRWQEARDAARERIGLRL